MSTTGICYGDYRLGKKRKGWAHTKAPNEPPSQAKLHLAVVYIVT